MAIHELQHFAFGDGVGGICQDAHDARIVQPHHHLEGARIEEVAHQHRGGIAEGRIGGTAPAPQVRRIDDVVMQQRRGMDELDDGGHFEPRTAPVAERARAQQEQRGPQALAARRDNVVGDLPHQ
jgi:hypothetical protein